MYGVMRKFLLFSLKKKGKMRILCWNCGGLGNPRTILMLLKYLRSQNADVAFFMETKKNSTEMERLWILFGMDGCLLMDVIGRLRGLALMWRRDVDIVVVSIQKTILIQRFSEKEGGKDRRESQMREFREVSDNCELEGLGFRGPKFTWWNNREEEAFIKCRLDKALRSDTWHELFPRAAIFNESPGASDHFAERLDLFHLQRVRWKRRLRYEEAWLYDDDCKRMIVEVLSNNDGSHRSLMKKLGLVKEMIWRCLTSVSYFVLGINLCRGELNITHLLFANSGMIFGRARGQEVCASKAIFMKYEKALGQKINMEKSALLFSRNIAEEDRQMVKRILGLYDVQWGGMYLGMPLIAGGSKKQIFNVVKGKIAKKITNWRNRLLLVVGREILIKAVAQAIPAYVMSCFKLSDSTCQEIDSVIAQFWAGDCKWKRQLLRLWFLKQDISQQPILRMLQLDLILATCGEALKRVKGLIRRVGDGKEISVSRGNWLPCDSPRPIMSFKCAVEDDLWVSKLIIENTVTWNVEKLNNIFLPCERDLVLSIPLSFRRSRDRQVWFFNNHGRYTVQSGYRLIQATSLNNVVDCSNDVNKAHGSLSLQQTRIVTWCLPRVCKMNVDAALVGKKTGAGFVCCKREGLTIPELELDNLIVVNWIKEKKVNGVLGNIVGDCIVLMHEVGCESIQYCPRVCNNVAHLIAKGVKEMVEEAVVWRKIEDVFSIVQDAVLRDRRSSN
ncbi:Uncharacterized protein TCM_008765 [Theobroma cacao]|uniref:RNase H type-1 domain-containing protein n=1 Tax=Theobroma cacao TaxID=3641 RepID=A0A061E4B6_THECC|nr:Uncharacterized protein TCM_008765 [Theobroma cacao]